MIVVEGKEGLGERMATWLCLMMDYWESASVEIKGRFGGIR